VLVLVLPAPRARVLRVLLQVLPPPRARVLVLVMVGWAEGHGHQRPRCSCDPRRARS